MDLRNIYRAFYPKAADYPFFSSVHGMFCRINHKLTTKQVSIKSGSVRSYQASSPTTENETRSQVGKGTNKNTNKQTKIMKKHTKCGDSVECYWITIGS